jgi:hypothetical protein
LKASQALDIPVQRELEASWPTSSCTTLVDQYVVALLFIEALRANTDFFPRFVAWKTSRPQIIVGLSMKGKLSTAHGIPPNFAFIWIRIFDTIDLKFLPRLMVLARTTYEGIGYSVKRNLFKSS